MTTALAPAMVGKVMYDSVRRRPIFRDVRGAFRGRGLAEREEVDAEARFL